MRKITLALAAFIGILATLGLSAPANAAATDTTKIWSGLGSGHLYEGSFDACTGAIAATGTTTGATGTYAETVTGTYNKATGSLTLTSVYGMDANGVVDDSTGVNNSAYAYTMTGTVTDNWFSGTYTITKTPVGGTPVTSDARSVQRRLVRGQRQRWHLHPAARPRRREPRRVRLRCRPRWHQGQGPGRDRQGRHPGRPVQGLIHPHTPTARPLPPGAGCCHTRPGRGVSHRRLRRSSDLC